MVGMTSPSDDTRRRTTWALAAVAGALVAFAVWWLWPDDGGPPSELADSGEAREGRGGGRSGRSMGGERFQPDGGVSAVTEGELIDSVEVDREEICSGESALVTVHTLGTEEQRKGYTVGVGTENGNPVAIRLANTGERTVIVRVTSPDGIIDRRELTLRVNDCAETSPGHVRVDVEPAGEAASFRFFARPVLNPDYFGGTPPRVRWSYEWDLGDGTVRHTEAPILEHAYAERDELQLHSSYPVRVRMTASGIDAIEGLTSVTIRNAFFENLRRDILSPQVTVGETRESGGTWLTDLEMRNPGDEDMHVERVHLGFVGCDPNDTFEDLELPAGQVLDATTIPAEARVGAMLTLPASLVPEGACRVVVDLIGTGPSGRPVRGSFGVIFRRPGRRTLARGDVESSRQHLDIAQAFRVLGRDPRQDTVTNLELRQLREQGLIGQPVERPEALPEGRPRRDHPPEGDLIRR